MSTNIKNTPIFITGAERSGSSIIARIVNHCGVFSGKITDMQENKKIKDLLDKYYVYNLHISPLGQYPLPNSLKIKVPEDWRITVLQSLQMELYNERIPWFYKSGRLAQTWPIWNHEFPLAKWIIVRRRTGDIIQSCMKTGWMIAFDNTYTLEKLGVSTIQEGWLWWVHQHEKMFIEMIEAGLNYREIWPERMATGDFEQVKEIIQWLDLEWKEDIPELVKPLFKNSSQKKGV